MRALAMTVRANHAALANFFEKNSKTSSGELRNVSSLLSSDVIEVHLTVVKRAPTIRARDVLELPK